MDALGGLFSTFIKLLYSTGNISVPEGFHDRCLKINEMFDDDVSGLVNTLLDYAVDSASDANYRIECSDETLEKLLNIWLKKINIKVDGVPTGLQSLSKEYFKERWEGSSFCILRAKNWEKITADNVSIIVPTVLWFVNGASIYVKRPNAKNYVLGTDKFYLDESLKTEIPINDKEFIVVQKPFDRWFSEYATPYTIRKGIYKNWLGLKTLQTKSDEVISKVLPYLFLMTKGTDELFKAGVSYSDPELQEAVTNFKEQVEKYKNQNGKLPMQGIPFDTKYEHLIPDLSKILKEELYRQGNRAILAGLGFVDMLEIEPSRQESRLNPKPFVTEVNDGVSGFKSILLEVIYKIIEKNKEKHPKLLSENGKILVVNSPLKINVEKILDSLRSGYDRGVLSIQTYQEILGVDNDTEKERRIKEAKDGDEDTFYPHITQNQEEKGKDTFVPSKPRNEKNEDQDKKKNTPESKTKTAEIINSPIDPNLEIAPYKDNSELPTYIKKMPEHAQTIFRETFNSVYEKTGDESKAFPIATNAAKRWLRKNGYTYNKENKSWKKKD